MVASHVLISGPESARTDIEGTKKMKSLFLLFTLLGLFLTSLDRLIAKEKVIAFDTKLSELTARFRPMREHYVAMAIFPLGMVASAYMMIRGLARDPHHSPLPAIAFLADLPNGVLLLLCLCGVALVWPLMGAILGVWLSIAENIPLQRGVVFGLLYFVVATIVAWIVLALYPVVYPLKGILVLNRKWFNSFSGVLGVALTIVGILIGILSTK